MGKFKKIIGIIIVTIMIMPIITVNASTKVDDIVDILKETAKSFNGKVTNENDTIEVNWESWASSETSEISISYNENIIEYNPGEIHNYEEAMSAIGHYMYASALIQVALEVNGYTEEEIRAFTKNHEFNYEVNGIGTTILGEEQEFIGDDDSTLSMTPVSIKIDITKANLNISNDDEQEIKQTTIEDIVDYINADSSFSEIKDDYGLIASQIEVSYDDENINFNITNNMYNYYNVYFPYEDDVISYEVDEINNFYEAESVVSHEMYAILIIQSALKLNGYTNEQIQTFFENNEFNYEINGIEFKENGEAVKYTNEDETSSVSVSPVSIKIDLEKANLNKLGDNGIEYVVLNGESQTFDVNGDNNLSFRFSIDFNTFKNEGKVYVDGKLVSSDNYELSMGSTIVTFNKEYTSSLTNGSHTIQASVNDGSVSTDFEITNVDNTTNNPQTGDNLIYYILMLVLSIIGLGGVIIYSKKKIKVQI